MTVSLCFSNKNLFKGKDEEDYYHITTLQFEFNLKEGIQYETGINKIVDFLLFKRKEKEEKEEKERVATQYATNAGFNFEDVCKVIMEKHLNTQTITEKNNDLDLDIYDFQLDLYEVYALLELQAVFEDKSKIIQYPYVYYFCGQYLRNHEFSKQELSQLNRILGFHDQKLNFVCKNSRIFIVFDNEHKLDIPVKVMEKCKNFLEKNREKSQNRILHYVTKNKEKIIDNCLTVLKCEKIYPSTAEDISKTKHVPLIEPYDDGYSENYSEPCIENLLVIDPKLITIDLENKVNNILGLQGFKLIAYCDRYNKDREEINEFTCRYGVYMEFPD
ncbi:MAG: hypothetical protein WD512_09565, partial [Candidatus Paceibacterota bacterium]